MGTLLLLMDWNTLPLCSFYEGFLNIPVYFNRGHFRNTIL